MHEQSHICIILHVDACFFHTTVLCVSILFHHFEFQLQSIPAYLLHFGDVMSGAVTGAGGYYACGANVATRACGRERGGGNINRGIKWWWQQKMAVSSNMVLFGFLCLVWSGEGKWRWCIATCPCVAFCHRFLIALHHQICHTRPAFCNLIRLPCFMHHEWNVSYTDALCFYGLHLHFFHLAFSSFFKEDIYLLKFKQLLFEYRFFISPE